MKKLNLLLLLFLVCLSFPGAYFVSQAYRSMDQEEEAALRYFADTLFNDMENALSLMVIREESREVDEYNPESQEEIPLSKDQQSYILGYIQNNPDGSFVSPGLKKTENPQKYLQLSRINTLFNGKRTSVPEKFEATATTIIKERAQKKEDTSGGFAEKYLKRAPKSVSKVYLGKEKKSVREITREQALNIASFDQEKRSEAPVPASEKPFDEILAQAEVQEMQSGRPAPASMARKKEAGLQVEIDPLQSVFISPREIFIFRRIVLHGKVYRQGFVINIKSFLTHLSERFFEDQPLARYTGLSFRVTHRGETTEALSSGVSDPSPIFIVRRNFPRPFSFLEAGLSCSKHPQSAGRKTIGAMAGLMVFILITGFLAIYKSVKTTMEMSERRSHFVSSVTHELKTPLTNIRMYVEMLEQGMAGTPEREQDYFRVITSESSRLSRLIHNVLEFSKLEKKTRHFNMTCGDLTEVICEVESVLGEKIRQEGFLLETDLASTRKFSYDREAMLQVLINLLENSVKFGRIEPEKSLRISVMPADGHAEIRVSDTGPGIPQSELKKVFRDFYRADNSLTRTTGGTGIGLSLVKKYVSGMGGTVSAVNNKGPGCTFIIRLPFEST